MKYQTLLNRVYEIHDLRKAVRVLTWDREVVMPKGGDEDRNHQITTLQRLCHTLYTSDDMGELIEGASEELNGASYRSPEASLIRFLRRDYERARRLPADFISRSSSINGEATAAWKKAREEDNFALFRPWLEKILDINREKAELLGYQDDPYDALLDSHEPGAKTSEIKAIFDSTKSALKPIYDAVLQRSTEVDDRILRQSFNVERQAIFARYLATTIGYDFNRGHLATAVHPFSTSLSRNDVRITTRYSENYLSPGIFATLHEAGHAIYVQNVHQTLNRTPLAKETSAALDESQSRLIENMIGRSQGFWKIHLPKLQEFFPSQLSDVSVSQFYQAINKVQPSLIRVEADELTYNLHIILRFELERKLINGELSAAEVPAAWKDKMSDLLGIVPGTDREGCLQDIHWTLVGFGYFPTYALGNLYAAQFYKAAQIQNPSIKDDLERGKTDSLLDWLRSNIHQHGRKFTPSEIVENATGYPLNHHDYIDYIFVKFSEVYGI